uniref:Uncharacterized protein n=1 Tax=Pararge aegeria TaxID=116150 RepID=S4PSZ8_9NEOP
MGGSTRSGPIIAQGRAAVVSTLPNEFDPTSYDLLLLECTVGLLRANLVLPSLTLVLTDEVVPNSLWSMATCFGRC